MLTILLGQITIKRIKWGSEGGEGGDFLQIVRPIGNILNPLWAFLNSQYYDL